jgi:hypothetical protein
MEYRMRQSLLAILLLTLPLQGICDELDIQGSGGMDKRALKGTIGMVCINSAGETISWNDRRASVDTNVADANVIDDFEECVHEVLEKWQSERKLRRQPPRAEEGEKGILKLLKTRSISLGELDELIGGYGTVRSIAEPYLLAQPR